MSDIDAELYGVDLFGEPMNPANDHDGILQERFGLPPFTVLNAREGWWQERKAAWLSLGIKSEGGRGGQHMSENSVYTGQSNWSGFRGPKHG